MTDQITPAQCRSARAFLGWQQKELADRAGISVETVKRIESNRKGPAFPHTARKIIAAFEGAGISLPSDMPAGAVPLPPGTEHTILLRDWFAGQALAGILAGSFADTIPHDDANGGGDAAFFAYQYADAMLKARGGRP